VAGSRISELTADRREYALNLVTEGDQDRDGDHRNEGENQGVLHESLAFLALHPAQRFFGANNYFVDHCFFTSSQLEIVQNLLFAHVAYSADSLTRSFGMPIEKMAQINLFQKV
jgi:hypothetical protein